jgi:RHS repeat-associated protein
MPGGIGNLPGGIGNLPGGGRTTWQASQTHGPTGQLAERTIFMGAGGIASPPIKDAWGYDTQGRPASQRVSIDSRETSRRQYTWGMAGKLTGIIDSIASIGLEYSYDSYGNLQSENCKGAKNQSTVRHLDESGRVYETRGKIERKYGRGGQLAEAKMQRYKYNDCGDLTEKRGHDGKAWRYSYNAGGLMEKVVRPDGKEVIFAYDPLGRRISKEFDGKATKFIWDGDKIIHEIVHEGLGDASAGRDGDGGRDGIRGDAGDAGGVAGFSGGADAGGYGVSGDAGTDGNASVTAWLFDEASFAPLAKLTETDAYTVITDHLGTPTAMVDQSGKKVWSETFDLWGRPHVEGETKVVGGAVINRPKPKKERGDVQDACPFRFPGQYEDAETGLYYNRFRYYMPDEGVYTQRDPIGLDGGNPTVYGYVWNVLVETDPLGLMWWFEKIINWNRAIHRYDWTCNSVKNICAYLRSEPQCHPGHLGFRV